MNGPDLDPIQHVDGARLRADLETLAAIGAHPDGGLDRPGLGEACRRAREWFWERMVEAGLEVRSDPAASLFGRQPGSDPDATTLLLGSHLDTVPRGGAFDGALGCVGALEVIRTLSEREADLRHPVEVVAWSDEEGVRFGPGLFGSRAATEGIEGDELKIEDDEAIPLSVALEETGGDPDRLPEARLDPARVACYLELHVEQGPVLDRAGESVGVVEGIVGISRWIVVAEGAANHAGTTPMRARRDSLVASARLAVGARNRIRGTDGAAVGNVGWIRAEPGAPNVVPGRSTLSLELRALDQDRIENLARGIRRDASSIGQEEGVRFDFRRVGRELPALTDPAVRDAIARAAREAGVPHRRMPSGAGHDAQTLARAGIPTGMIFVPSRDGVSHAPGEHTDWADCARGVEVLYRSLRVLDRDLRVSDTQNHEPDDP